MAKLTKADAARQLGISRTTLYKLIDQGKLSATPDGLIDTAELVRVMSTMNVHGERQLTPLDTSAMDTATSENEHYERPGRTSSEHQEWTSSERQLTSSYRDLVDILREQLQAAQERERDYREHIARLTAMLDQAHQQNQRLLEAPRPASSCSTAPDRAPDTTTARAAVGRHGR
jgi:Helix-turn-helix domain